MEQNIEKKPCLIKTSQGFSVIYQNRFLYSKYNPQKSILNLISTCQILPGTLILAYSPVLCYGIKELCSKLPENCFILGCEFDQELLEFSKPYIQAAEKENPESFAMASIKDLYSLNALLLKKMPVLSENKLFPAAGTFRRTIKIDFSAGTVFNAELYSSLLTVTQNAIGTFWKNRITITKFGRRYCHNIFRNLTVFPHSVSFSKIKNTVEKPILVLGTGSSVSETVSSLVKFNGKDRFFIVALDATLPVLKSYGIKSDLTVCEESQAVIAGMFTGSRKIAKIACAGLTSCPDTSSFSAEYTSFFFPQFYDADFIKTLCQMDFFPEKIPPLGSVGLTAIYISLKIRKSELVPVFFSGLDFSYLPGMTHAKESVVYKRNMWSSNRIKPFQNFSSSFSASSIKTMDKNGCQVITTPSLSAYAQSFYMFENQKNLYDIRRNGLTLPLPEGNDFFEQILINPPLIPEIFKRSEKINNKTDFLKPYSTLIYSDEEKVLIKKQIQKYFLNEKSSLEEAKAILTGNIKLSPEKTEEKLTELLKNRDYLYSHFPDGIKFSTSISFLKRIRPELDFFIKDFTTGLKILENH